MTWTSHLASCTPDAGINRFSTRCTILELGCQAGSTCLPYCWRVCWYISIAICSSISGVTTLNRFLPDTLFQQQHHHHQPMNDRSPKRKV